VELAKVQDALRRQAEVYIINPDTPENSRKVREQTGLAIPILLDPGYTAAKLFDLAGAGRPMGGLVGYVIIDGAGLIRLQRVDIDFGRYAVQILAILNNMRQFSR